MTPTGPYARLVPLGTPLMTAAGTTRTVGSLRSTPITRTARITRNRTTSSKEQRP